MKCVNENCKKNPLDTKSAILVGADGDFACCKKCKIKYEKQRDQFFNNIGNDKWYENWLDKKI